MEGAIVRCDSLDAKGELTGKRTVFSRATSITLIFQSRKYQSSSKQQTFRKLGGVSPDSVRARERRRRPGENRISPRRGEIVRNRHSNSGATRRVRHDDQRTPSAEQDRHRRTQKKGAFVELGARRHSTVQTEQKIKESSR